MQLPPSRVPLFPLITEPFSWAHEMTSSQKTAAKYLRVHRVDTLQENKNDWKIDTLISYSLVLFGNILLFQQYFLLDRLFVSIFMGFDYFTLLQIAAFSPSP